MNLEFSPLSPRKRLRPIRQGEAAECGLACLAMVAAYHGHEVALASLRRRYGASIRGLGLRSIMEAAESFHLQGRALKIRLEGLATLRTPAILHWDMRHYVVLERVKGSRFLIHDPAGGSAWFELSEISRHFTGVALELFPTIAFERRREQERMRLRDVVSGVGGLGRSALLILVLTVSVQAFVIVAPFYLQLAIDVGIPSGDIALLRWLALVFALVAVLAGCAEYLRNSIVLATGAVVGLSLSATTGHRLVRLPIDWFQKRGAGDILSRFQSVTPVQRFLTQTSIVAVLDTITAVCLLAAMIYFSLPLAFLALAAMLGYAVFRAILAQRQRLAEAYLVNDEAKAQNVAIETIRNIQSLRLLNKGRSRHAVWLARTGDAIASQVAVERLAALGRVTQTGIIGVENVLSFMIGAYLVIEGSLTLGMLVAFAAYKAVFLFKASSVADQLASLRTLRLHLERIGEIALEAEDDPAMLDPEGPRQPFRELEIRDLAYRYSPTDRTIVAGASLTLKAGDNIAITGPSGSGKSTLAKLMVGLLRPTAGEVRVDGQRLETYGSANLREVCACVLQDELLFAGSIADNINVFDDEHDEARLADAAAGAAILVEVQAMPMRFDSLIGDAGAGLSGGQRQRVLLARALYREPQLIILDEATSQVDERNEAAIYAALAARGMTVLTLAHRPDTLRRASRVFELNDGLLVPRS